METSSSCRSPASPPSLADGHPAQSLPVSCATFPVSEESSCRLGSRLRRQWLSSVHLSPATPDLGHRETRWSSWALCRGTFPGLRVPSGPGLQSPFSGGWRQASVPPVLRARCLLQAWGQARSMSPSAPAPVLSHSEHSDPVPIGPGHPGSPVWAELLSRSWCWQGRERGERPVCPGTFLLAAPLHSELLRAARLPSRSLRADPDWDQGQLLAPVLLLLGPGFP